MKIRKLFIVAMFVTLSGCVSNQAMQSVQAGDDEKSCVALKSELASLGAKFEDAKDDSGVTGKNVGLALVFWPGIIVNEVRANKNQDSIDARISHLSAIYNARCLGEDENRGSNMNVASKLKELAELHKNGLINDQEYEDARKKALESL